MIRLTALSFAILERLHFALREGINDGHITIEDIHRSLPIHISEAFVRRATDEFLFNDYISYNRNQDAVSITNKGIRYFDTQVGKKDSYIQQILDDEIAYFQKGAGIDRLEVIGF